MRRKCHKPYNHGLGLQGFTLVEVMIVIVILSIFAGMMTLSVGGSESRRNKAFYEHLQSNINYVRLLSIEQMQPYGLAIQLAKVNQPSEIRVVKLQLTNTQPASNPAAQSAPSWQLEKSIEPLVIPENVDVAISPLDNINANSMNQNPSSQTPNWLVGSEAPPVVWFGTGEATPVQITVKAKNGDSIYLVDDPIIINAAGSLEPSQNSNTNAATLQGASP